MFKIPNEEIDLNRKLLREISIFRWPDKYFKFPPDALVICAVSTKEGIKYYACETEEDISKIFKKECSVLSWHSVTWEVERIAMGITAVPGGLLIGVTREGKNTRIKTMWIIKDQTGTKKLGFDTGPSIVAYRTQRLAQTLIDDLALHGAKPFEVDSKTLYEQAKRNDKKILKDPPLEHFFSQKPEFF